MENEKKARRVTKVIILLMSVSFLVASFTGCEKPEIKLSSVSLSLVKAGFYTTKAKGLQCRNLKPITALMETDKGAYFFDLIPIIGGYKTDPIEIESGEYRIYKLVLMDEKGTVTHYVHEGRPSNDGSIVGSWVDGYKYDLNGDFDILLQIHCE